MSGGEADDAERLLQPLWRGLVIYRAVAFGYAGVLVLISRTEYRYPAAAAAVLVAIGVWTVLTAWGYLGRMRAGRLAVLDLAVTVAAIGSTVVVDTPARIAGGAPVLPTVWVAGPAIALALAYGALAGLGGAVVVQLAVIAVRGDLGPVQITDLFLLVVASLAVGSAATVLRGSAERMRRAVALRAAVRERERLARSIHDGVLQVLAHVRRRGTELGGEAAELGRLAGEQEVSLRALITSDTVARRPDGRIDLAAALSGLAGARVTVSVPGPPVVLPEQVAEELVAAVREALANVAGHVGPDAPAWVLVEDLPDRVLVSVRDDGPGIPAGRLAAARDKGRIGVAGGILGRIEAVGGSACCETGPDIGTEWSISVPREEVR